MINAQTPADAKRLEINRSQITPMLLKMFDLWSLTTEERLSALGLSTKNRAALKRYTNGSSISASRDMLDRAGNLLAINSDLKLLFPKNPELAYSWMKTRNRALNGNSPIETIAVMGFPGLLFIRSYLNRALAN